MALGTEGLGLEALCTPKATWPRVRPCLDQLGLAQAGLCGHHLHLLLSPPAQAVLGGAGGGAPLWGSPAQSHHLVLYRKP